VQAALKAITMFFPLGPIVVTTPDILTWSTLGISLQNIVVDQGVSAPSNTVPITAAETAESMWLQPVLDGKRTEWMPFGIEASEGKPG
jgi:hypothetical protein